VKSLEAPKTWIVYGGLGTLLWLTLAVTERASGGSDWRGILYRVLAAGSIYMFVRALLTFRSRTRANSGIDDK
jgi:hypothetical protein